MADLPSPKWQAWRKDTEHTLRWIRDTLTRCGLEVTGQLAVDLYRVVFALERKVHEVADMNIGEIVERLRTRHLVHTAALREVLPLTLPDVIRKIIETTSKEELSPGLPKGKSSAPQDGPFGTDGFRFHGVEIRFRRAILKRRFVLALWDDVNHRLSQARPIEEVMCDVYGEDHKTEENTFRQLISAIRKLFANGGCPLLVDHSQGKVQLSPRPS